VFYFLITRMRKISAFRSATLWVCLIAPISLPAQTTINGSLRGVVSDQSGARVAGLRIVLEN
jgi:hypothetical protein